MNALFFYYSKLLRTIRRHFFLVKTGPGKIRPIGKINCKSKTRETPEMILSGEKEWGMKLKTGKKRIFRRQAESLCYVKAADLKNRSGNPD
jgi:hypothetical protein